MSRPPLVDGVRSDGIDFGAARRNPVWVDTTNRTSGSIHFDEFKADNEVQTHMEQDSERNLGGVGPVACLRVCDLEDEGGHAHANPQPQVFDVGLLASTASDGCVLGVQIWSADCAIELRRVGPVVSAVSRVVGSANNHR